jgi:hypothetical protein
MPDMEHHETDFAHQAATAVGDSIEKTSALVIDQVEDLSIWMMEKAADNNPNSEGLAQIGDIVHNARQVMNHIPRLAGSLAAGSTFFGLRLGSLALRAMREFADTPEREA